jgi:uncharacterized protein
MSLPLMPKATAVWLVENTALSFEQIAEFCGMHPLEVQGIADGEVATGIMGIDPTSNGQLTREMIEAAEGDEKRSLKLADTARQYVQQKTKGARYTPVARRADKPDAVSWILKYHPEVPDSQIVKLIGTTKNTIDAVRDKSHWNSTNIKPKDPVLLGLCTQTHLDSVIEKARKTNPKKQNSA